MKNFDWFGASLEFNVKGQEKIKTWSGCFFTTIAMLLILGFAGLKLIHTVEKRNPTIFSTEEIDAYDSTFAIDIKEVNFKFAFGIRDYLDRKTFKIDPAYVKPVVKYLQKFDDGTTNDVLLKVHQCN